ncbi:MAG: hypothetical protein PVH61_25510 [Candidatus Aminicenantes bacterium]|jgi:hypothetical protein
MEDIVKAILSNAAGAILATGVIAFLTAFRKFRPPKRKERDLNGIWLAQYTYLFEEKKCTKTHLILVKHYREKLSAKYLCGDSPSYFVSAMLRFKNYLSGTWANDDPNDEIHGAFIIEIVPGKRGILFEGAWVGLEKEGKIQTGDYHWLRIVSKRKRKEIRKAEKLCIKLGIPTKHQGAGISSPLDFGNHEQIQKILTLIKDNEDKEQQKDKGQYNQL